MKNFTRAASTAVFMMVASFGAMAVDHLSIIGSATPGGWEIADGLLMVQEPENPEIFTYTGWLSADGEFKFTAWHNWDRPDLEFRNISEDPYNISGLISGDKGADNKFKVTESANYNVVCNLSDLTIKVEKAKYQEKPVRFNGLFFVGNATPGGWECKDATPMIWAGMNDPFKFTFTGELKATAEAPGEFKITTNPFSGWGGVWFFAGVDAEGNVDYNKISTDSTGDRKWMIDETKSYNVAVDLLTDAISITPSSASGINEIENDNMANAVYYNLQGVIVTNPSSGIFIRKAGNKVSKVVL